MHLLEPRCFKTGQENSTQDETKREVKASDRRMARNKIMLHQREKKKLMRLGQKKKSNLHSVETREREKTIFSLSFYRFRTAAVEGTLTPE